MLNQMAAISDTLVAILDSRWWPSWIHGGGHLGFTVTTIFEFGTRYGL
jgi:hypothetical protein